MKLSINDEICFSADFTFLLMGKVANADIRRDYKCKSLAYIEVNHAGELKI